MREMRKIGYDSESGKIWVTFPLEKRGDIQEIFTCGAGKIVIMLTDELGVLPSNIVSVTAVCARSKNNLPNGLNVRDGMKIGGRASIADGVMTAVFENIPKDMFFKVGVCYKDGLVWASNCSIKGGGLSGDGEVFRIS